jgi:hypothetical protein
VNCVIVCIQLYCELCNSVLRDHVEQKELYSTIFTNCVITNFKRDIIVLGHSSVHSSAVLGHSSAVLGHSTAEVQQ